MNKELIKQQVSKLGFKLDELQEGYQDHFLEDINFRAGDKDYSLSVTIESNYSSIETSKQTIEHPSEWSEFLDCEVIDIFLLEEDEDIDFITDEELQFFDELKQIITKNIYHD